ncbi:uncharacterized protein LOC126836702 [Adelges cooleyi]|uniref:uncharacterized protein LOC126836702 n=1 Tax=Adelges cooleyi TaxID=133065 RepID=UPI00217F8E2D|nr:uncharacterized protein LOC126836702 [Adelges cooleyi]
MPCTNYGQIQFLAVIVLFCGVLVTFVMAGNNLTLPCVKGPMNRDISDFSDTDFIDTDFNMDTNVIDTGCEETDYITFRQDPRLHLNLRCTYMINSIIHLSLTQVLLDGNADLRQTIETITMYENVAQKQMSTLYELDAARSPTLWALFYYLQLLNKPHHPYPDRSLLSTEHKYNCKLIQDEYDATCPQNNRLAVNLSLSANEYLEIYGKPDILLEKTRTYVSKNIALIESLIRSNYRSGLKRASYHSLFLHDLLLNGFGLYQNISNIYKEYDVGINWGKLSENASNSYNEARIFHRDNSNFSYLVECQTMCINFLKLMMARFSEIHFKFMIVLINLHEFNLVKSYMQEWLAILTDFAEFLSLNDDKDVIKLERGYKSFFWVPRSKIDVVMKFDSDINTIVTKLAEDLDVEVDETFDFTGVSEGEQLETIENRIEKKTIDSAHQFIGRIKTFFNGNNFFKIINMIIKL